MLILVRQKPQPAKKAKKKKEDKKEEDDGSRDLGMPAEEKKAPHPLAVLDKEAKSPFVGDTWKKVSDFLAQFMAGVADSAVCRSSGSIHRFVYLQ